MGEFKGRAVMAQQDGMPVSAYHPELADDERVHRYFLAMVDAVTQVPALSTGGKDVGTFQVVIDKA